MIVEIDGQRYEVPDDATPEEIDALTSAPKQTIGGHFFGREVPAKTAPVDSTGFHADRVSPYFQNLLTGAAKGISSGSGPLSRLVRESLLYPGELADLDRLHQQAKGQAGTGVGEFLGEMYQPENAMAGEVGGAVLSTAAQAVAPRLSGALRALAEKAAVRSTNADRTAVRRAFKGSDTARQALGRFMLDEKVPLRSPKAIRDAAQEIADTAGPEIGNLASAADQAGATVDLAAAVNAAKAARAVADLSKNTVTRETHTKIVSMLEDQLAQHGGRIPPSVAHDIRMQLDQLANWDQAAPKQVQSAWRAARGAVDDALDTSMKGAGMGDEWAAANNRFSQSRKLSNPNKRGLADIGTERREGNRLGSPSEKASAMAGAITAATANPAAGVAIPAATIALNRYFFPASARTLNALSRAPITSAARPAARVAVTEASPTLIDFLRGLRMQPVGAAADEDQK